MDDAQIIAEVRQGKTAAFNELVLKYQDRLLNAVVYISGGREEADASTRFQDSVLVQNKIAVLAVLFFVTGFLGLPLLWLSPLFSNAERWIWATINTIYTCTLVWIVFKICMWSWTQISSSF